MLYVFLVLAHERRRILHVGVTDHRHGPPSNCAKSFPGRPVRSICYEVAIRFSVATFVEQVTALGMSEVLSTPGSSWQRAYIERVIAPSGGNAWIP
jgi:hypothetical protein